MVVGETNSEAGPSTQQTTGPPANIDNIMSGIGNTGAVKMNNHRKKLRQRFDIIKKLGQGTYGKVQLGINKETGQEVAIKTIKKCKIETDADLIRIRREVQIMSSVQHPNIIHIYEVFENREKMVLVMEFAAGGELYDYLSERKVLSEDEARRVFRQISTAVYYCHKHKICHRDLKLENILLDENGNAKIADFGLSNVFDEQRLLATFCGSPLYASPEIVKGTPYQGPEVDCWSLGVLLYTLVYGAMPFDGSNFKRLVKQISQGDYFEPKKPSRASPLIREMLTVCPKRRANIEQICNHWWVNEGYKESCLDLAEELANQTPVRLDVLLSLSPPSITADQLVVTGPEESKSTDRVPRSHSVGSIIDLGGNTEAERRILDMVAAGGEAALMPSPTRTLTPAESPAQTKRKLESTVSTENAIGVMKKKEKPSESHSLSNINIAKSDIMEAEPENVSLEETILPRDDESNNVVKNVDTVEDNSNAPLTKEEIIETPQINEKNSKKVEKMDATEETKDVTKVKPKGTVKVIKKIGSKSKAAELPKVDEVKAESMPGVDENVENENQNQSTENINSSPEENISKSTIRRKSRIFEAAEKFQNINNQNSDKIKKNSLSGASVGSFRKDFERRSSVPLTATLQIEKNRSDSQDEASNSRKNSLDNIEISSQFTGQNAKNNENLKSDELKESDSKSSLRNFSLEEARKSMENSIALLNKAKTESSKEVDQLCAKTEGGVDVSENLEREKKLKNAREIIGNAIQPGRLCMGVRKPPVPFGLNGRSISGSVVPLTNTSNSGDRKLKVQLGPELSDIRTATFSVSSPEQKTFSQEPLAGTSKPIAIGTLVENVDPDHLTKTSRAEITLKSATLPRRKPAKTEIQLDIQTKQEPSSMRFSTEMKHPVADLRSAPIREHQVPYSPISVHQRATSLEPQAKELIIPIQRPPTYQRTGSNSFRAGSLSRQSTNDSDTDTTITLSQSNVSSGGISQPIKKSPREFIIPISVEGGGYITPRAGSLEPSESNASSSFSRIGRNRRMGSLLNDKDSEDDLLFQRLHRHTSLGRDSDSEEPKFTMHRLRSTRPSKKGSQEGNDSASSGEEDDEDGFEILTAENLFSTLLQRVRALTQRLNVSNDTSSAFPSSRFINSLRQSTAHNPFWHHDPFGSRLNNGSSAWRHSMTRDLSSDFDSMFSRSGATLPRGIKFKTNSNEQQQQHQQQQQSQATKSQQPSYDNQLITDDGEILDLRDLDLSQLRLTKKDLETLSSLTPGLSKRLQEQLLAQLPPTQAKKLSRTLSMQNYSSQPIKVYKRSLSGGRDINETFCDVNDQKIMQNISDKLTTNMKGLTSTANKGIEISKDDNILDRNSLYRRSVSRSKYDDTNSVSRSSSRCRNAFDSEDCSQSLRSSYSSEISDRFRSHTPQMDDYLNPYNRNMKYLHHEKSISPSKYNSLPLRNNCLSPSKDTIGRPPSGCLSPPPLPTDPSLRRRSSQRRISRFLRPDFFDTPREESVYVKDKMDRDQESQRILREIRERSQDRQERKEITHDNTKKLTSNNITDGLNINYNNQNQTKVNIEKPIIGNQVDDNNNKNAENNNNNNSNADNNSEEKKSFADKILEELQCISLYETKGKSKTEDKQVAAVISEKDGNNNINLEVSSDQPPPPATIIINKDGKKVKIIKRIKKKLVPSNNNENQQTDDIIKSKSAIDTNKDTLEANIKSCNPKELINDIKMVTNLTNEIDSVILLNTSNEKQSASSNIVKLKKESKLIRPKSYPSKEPEKIIKPLPNKNEIKLDKQDVTKIGTVLDENNIEEYRHVRPQSYPTVDIITPNALKNKKDVISNEKSDKLDGNAQALQTISAETKISVNKDTDSAPPPPIEPIKSVKKITRIVKKVVPKSDKIEKDGIKEKLNKKSPENSITLINTIKEKSPEKKPSKGFLYSIGQKFEKLRESSKEKIKEKKAAKEEIMQETKIDTNGVKLENLDNVPDDQNAIIPNIKIKRSKLNEGNNVSNQNMTESTTLGDEDLSPIKIDKKSRIDTMIRNLRERSVPRGPTITESGLIKRAVSVEDLPGSFNKRGVNKVLGLFKKYEKENSTEVVDSSKTISNNMNGINNANNINNNSSSKERPKSSGFVSKIKKGHPYTGAKSDTILTLTEEMHKKCLIDQINNINCSENVTKIPIVYNCPDCSEMQDSVTKRQSTIESKLSNEDRERIRNNRKGLMLDFSKLDTTDNNMLKTNNLNNNQNKQMQQKHSNMNSQTMNYQLSNVSNDSNNNNNSNDNNNNNINTNKRKINNNNNNENNTNFVDKNKIDSNNNNNNININDSNNNNNNYIYQPSSLHNEINQNHINAEPFENNMMSPDSRSPYDDCASTSTFFSPSTEEPELYFDNWSNCSDDHFTMTPSPSQSRLSRNSHLDSPANDNSNESIVDRIRRKSFYTRFNEKKPKRVSNIVGPAAKDYYRDTATRSKSKPPEYTRSFTSTLPEQKVRNIHEYYRPIKSSIDNYYSATKTPNNNKLRHDQDDFNKTKTSLSDYQSPLTSLHRSSGYGNDYKYNSDIGNSYKKHDDIFTNGKTLISKNSVYDPSLSIYGTYNPKRHIPTTSTPSYTSSSTTSNLDNYGTLGRKIKPYEQRSVSLLDSSSSTFNRVLGTLRREPRASVELGGVARSNLRVRNQSTSRSPSNI